MKDNQMSGLILGLLMGTALGVALDNLALWMALGLAIGAGIDGMRRKQAADKGLVESADEQLAEGRIDEPLSDEAVEDIEKTIEQIDRTE